MRLTSGDHGESGDPGDRADDCPDWCRRLHGPDDHDDDRLHQSAPILVPVVLGDPRLGPDRVGRGDTLVLRLFQRFDATTTWLEAVPEEGRALHLLVTAESAHRLTTALGTLLDRL